MEKFSVNKKICKKCGHCVVICPTHTLALDENGFPMPAQEDVWGKCMKCGHCVSICPVSALSPPTMDVKKCPPLMPIRPYSQEKLLQLFSQRRSVRQFKPKVISREDIRALLEIAELAPSAINIHPIRWIAVNGREVLEDVIKLCIKEMKKIESPYLAYFIKAYEEKGQDQILRGCSNVVIAYAPEKAPWGLTDGVIATTHLELAASLKGFGACWAGLVLMCIKSSNSLRKKIGLPKGMTAVGALLMGYPKFHFHHIPERKQPEIQWVE